MLFPLVLCAVVLTGSGKVQDDEWIDPTDMLNYDAASGTMRRPYKANYHDSEDKSVDTVSTEILSSCSREVDSLQQKIADCEKRNAKSRESRSFYIFKRYLNKILNEAGKLGLPEEDVGHVHYDAEIILTKQTYLEIVRFLNEETWQAGAVDDALSDILINFKHHDYKAWHWRFEDTFGIDLYNMFLILLCLVCVVVVIATELWTRIHWFVQLKRVLLISFLISFAWNWLYLYKARDKCFIHGDKVADYNGIGFNEEELRLLGYSPTTESQSPRLVTRIQLQLVRPSSSRVPGSRMALECEWTTWIESMKNLAFAQHQAEIAKMGHFDNVCAEKLGWRESLVEWLRSTWTIQDDPCQKYYETLLVNPVLLVPPTKALAITFTNFVTEPLKHVGQGIGEFIKALMKEIPFILQVPVLIMMALAVLAFCYGAGSSVSVLRYLTSSQRKSLPPPDSPQEKIDLGRYDGSRSDGYYLQKFPYAPRGPYDRGDAPTRPGNGSRSPNIMRTSDEPDMQVEESHKPEPGNRLHTESEVCRLETITADNLTEERAPEQQERETSEAERETGENCYPNTNLEGKSCATEPCEEQKNSSSRDSQEGD